MNFNAYPTAFIVTLLVFLFYLFHFVLFCPFSRWNRNINIPWPSQGMGDGDYMYAFQQVIVPIASEFDPDLLIGRTHPLFVRFGCTNALTAERSCFWIWCGSWWWAWRLFCYPGLLCPHDAYAYDPREWQGSCLSWGVTSLCAPLHSLRGTYSNKWER